MTDTEETTPENEKETQEEQKESDDKFGDTEAGPDTEEITHTGD